MTQEKLTFKWWTIPLCTNMTWGNSKDSLPACRFSKFDWSFRFVSVLLISLVMLYQHVTVLLMLYFGCRLLCTKKCWHAFNFFLVLECLKSWEAAATWSTSKQTKLWQQTWDIQTTIITITTHYSVRAALRVERLGYVLSLLHFSPFSCSRLSTSHFLLPFRSPYILFTSLGSRSSCWAPASFEWLLPLWEFSWHWSGCFCNRHRHSDKSYWLRKSGCVGYVV